MVQPGAPPPDVQARIIGRYALYGEIAAGGMATVHLGRLVGPVGFSRTVAIKRLHPQFAKDPEFVSMFLDEARLAARIQHPNVVSTLDVVALEGEVFLVMEYIQGESLSKLVRACRRKDTLVPPRIASSVVAAALHGLHAAHEAKSERGEPLNIVHRDISPQNILVGVDGVARVLDFGVAKAAMRAQTTRDGQMKGKLGYMSPEQLHGKGVDRRTDVFAAGVVLWEALTGRRLFDGADAGEIMMKVMSADIPQPGLVVPSIPPQLDSITMRALERDPSNRFASAREFAIALEQAGAAALNREVGEWVEQIGGDALAARAERVAEIESISTAGAPFGAQAQELAAHRRSVAEIDAPIPAGGSSPSGVSGVSQPGSHPSQHLSQPSWHGQLPTGEGTSPSQVTNLSVASGAALPAPPTGRRGLYAALLGVAAALALVLVVSVVALLRHAHGVTPPTASGAPLSAASAPQTELSPLGSAAAAQPTAPAASASAAPSAASASAAASAEPAPSASAPESQHVAAPEAHKAAAHPVHHAASRPARQHKAAAKPDCNPPYYLDANGIQHAKPQCL